VAACGSHASGALPPGPSGDGGTGQKEAGSAEDAMSGPANAYFASTLGGSDGCGLHVPAGTPFLSIGAEGNPVSNGGSFMGSSVSVICQVSATGTSSYNVNAQVGYGPQNGFNLSGTLSNVSGPQPNFTAQFTSASISYNESMCTVTLKPGGNAMNPSITSGRVWATLECPALTNMTTSGDVCAGQATFIFQNCAD
jgi:hypothetical protein